MPISSIHQSNTGNKYPSSTTLQTALLALYAIQEWMRLPLTKDGCPYGPGFFPNKASAVKRAIQKETRGALLRLIRSNHCICCQVPLSMSGTGDHLVPRSKQGSNSASNYLPLCKRCNSSKGNRDLMKWWQMKEKPLNQLHPDAICLYARTIYQCSTTERTLLRTAPSYLIELINQFLTTLPTTDHAILLIKAYNDNSLTAHISKGGCPE